MISRRFACGVCAGVLVALGLIGSPEAALAQSASGIAGVVRDSSGAVLPGVTVEAASPALIEGARTTVTGTNGTFQITDLRPANTLSPSR